MDNTEITQRFFQAIDRLQADHILASFRQFAREHCIDRRNMAQQRKEPSRTIIKPWWLTILVKDYNISARWLLTGEGTIYEKG